MRHYDCGATLHTLIAVFSGRPAVEAGIVNLKAAIKAGRSRTLRVKYLRTDECRSVVPMLTQDVRKVGQFRQ